MKVIRETRSAFYIQYTLYKKGPILIYSLFFTSISLLIWLKQYFLKLLSVLVLAMSLDTFRFQVAYCINIQFFFVPIMSNTAGVL